VCERNIYWQKQKEVFVAFMYSENTYDRVDRVAISGVLRLYGVGGRILSAINGMHEESMACVIIGRKLVRKTKVDVGLRHGYVMSPCLLNIFIHGVVGAVDARVMDRGAALMFDSGGEWQLNQILCEDDTTLVGDEECKLQ
jgi:hypothetical protein